MNKAKASDTTAIVQSVTHVNDENRHSRINSQLVQNVLLVWLDSNIDENSSDCIDTIKNFRRIFNTICMFTDTEKCINFLGDIVNEKACMVISDSLGPQIIPLVHNMFQVDSIFIFYKNKASDEEWMKNWPKIKGGFTEVESLCKILNKSVQQCEKNAISISVIGSGDSLTGMSGNRLDPSFMYTQIMKEIFLTINFEQQHLDEFIQHCTKIFADNEKQLEYVHEFAQQYHRHTPIWWYTRDSFLYSMLNRALRMMDADLMIKLGFFIDDLHRHIEQLYQKQFGNESSSSNQSFTVYRGQGMNKEIFDKIIANKGGLMSFNSFLSTSKDRDLSLMFADSAAQNPDLIGIFFVMDINPAQSNTPFASVTDVGYFGKEEDEVLFSTNTVFRIGESISIDGNPRLFQVQLNLASDKDNDLRQLIDCIREETFPGIEGWYRLGLALGKAGEYTKAQQLYEVILKRDIDENVKATIYDQLGWIIYELGEYAKAITYFEKSIEIRIKTMPWNNSGLNMSYNHIGVVYGTIGDYSQALSFFEKALAIEEQLLPPTHPDLAASYGNIANVYGIMGDYLKALSFYEKVLTIQQKSLPAIHPSLAASYTNIGNIYSSIGTHSKALSSYEKALTIKEQSVPSTHPTIADSYNNIGIAYFNMGDYSKALLSYEKALTIRQQSYHPTHPSVADSYNNIGLMYFNMGDYPKALSSYEKALEIQQQLPTDIYPGKADLYNNIGLMYSNIGDYSKALSSYERLLAIQQQLLPPIHPDLATTYSNIAAIYNNMNNYRKALPFYEKALVIQQQSLHPNHSDLVKTYYNTGLVHKNMGNNWKAHSYFEHLLDIVQSLFPPNHPQLQLFRIILADIKKNL